MQEARARVIVLRLACAIVAAPLVWYTMAMGYNALVWAFGQGHPVFGPYGREKSLSNLVVEFPLVMILTAVALLFTAPGTDRRWWPRAVCVIILVSGVVTILVPGLPE